MAFDVAIERRGSGQEAWGWLCHLVWLSIFWLSIFLAIYFFGRLFERRSQSCGDYTP